MEDIRINDDYEKICLKCRREKYFRCNECGCTYPKQEACNYKGEMFCEDCFRSSVSSDILDGTLNISALSISDKKITRTTASASYGISGIRSEEDAAAFFEDGYADDYVGDGLDGKDNYLGDGLDE